MKLKNLATITSYFFAFIAVFSIITYVLVSFRAGRMQRLDYLVESCDLPIVRECYSVQISSNSYKYDEFKEPGTLLDGLEELMYVYGADEDGRQDGRKILYIASQETRDHYLSRSEEEMCVRIKQSKLFGYDPYIDELVGSLTDDIPDYKLPLEFFQVGSCQSEAELLTDYEGNVFEYDYEGVVWQRKYLLARKY